MTRCLRLCIAGMVAFTGATAVAAAETPSPMGVVPSAAPGILDTPDGWHIEVAGSAETQLPIAPLTTAVSTREYLVGGTFSGSVTGTGGARLAGGTMVVGYQIGCGVLADDIEIAPNFGLDIGLPEIDVDGEIDLDGSIDLLPGQISVVDVADKTFDGNVVRVTVTGLRVSFDRCVGQSFIRSYATLAIATADTVNVVTYLGVAEIA